MTTPTAINTVNNQSQSGAALEQVILGGDLARLTPIQKVQYYTRVCELVGLNPTTKPFDYLKLNGREVLYANKGCAEQLRQNRKVSIEVTATVKIDDVFVVTVKATDSTGRIDSATGAVSVAGLRGDALANAMMKAETKAKRRVTLSICGLNMLDESETDSLGPPVRPDQPGEEDGTPYEQDYRITFGKWAKRSLEEVVRTQGPEAVASYIDFLESSSAKSGKQFTPAVKEFVDRASKYLADLENGKVDPKENEQEQPPIDWEGAPV